MGGGGGGSWAPASTNFYSVVPGVVSQINSLRIEHKIPRISLNFTVAVGVVWLLLPYRWHLTLKPGAFCSSSDIFMLRW